jgi:large subunit ribosomal protein L10
VKNTLCERAVEGTDKEKLGAHFRGNIAVLFSGSDPIAAAKLLKDQLKDSEKFTVKAGFFDGDVLDMKGVEGVAGMASREDLLSQLLATVQAGPQQILGIIQAAPRDLLYVLNNYAAKLEGEGQS